MLRLASHAVHFQIQHIFATSTGSAQMTTQQSLDYQQQKKGLFAQILTQAYICGEYAIRLFFFF